MSLFTFPGAAADPAPEREEAEPGNRSSLAGNVAIVTGAARGIGRAVALGLADQGAAVVMTDVDPIEMPERHRGRGELLTHRGDITNSDDVRSAVAAATTTFGGIDIVVNVAGILGTAPAHRVTLSEWDRLIGAPLTGTLNLLAAVRGPMGERGGGAIVTFTSASALTGAGDMIGYTGGKCAAIGLVRALAGELAQLGIRINAVSPSAATRMLAAAPANSSEAPDAILPAFAAREPEQVASFIGYLVSAQASDVTGRVFLATGGYLIEYGPPRVYKQFTVPEPAGVREVANGLRWVLGRPALDRIGYGPTRRFEIDAVNAHLADV
jgi:NAD(P)-dependent dehydrogenase (short-subunit alcohol dehydrogenase family)